MAQNEPNEYMMELPETPAQQISLKFPRTLLYLLEAGHMYIPNWTAVESEISQEVYTFTIWSFLSDMYEGFNIFLAIDHTWTDYIS